jgi:hypothetical protein
MAAMRKQNERKNLLALKGSRMHMRTSSKGTAEDY